jgi:hypothetical protein
MCSDPTDVFGHVLNSTKIAELDVFFLGILQALLRLSREPTARCVTPVL